MIPPTHVVRRSSPRSAQTNTHRKSTATKRRLQGCLHERDRPAQVVAAVELAEMEPKREPAAEERAQSATGPGHSTAGHADPAPNSRGPGEITMKVHHGIVDAIGKTPLIRLKTASEATGCEILGKAEFMNPGQSVKDRAALYIILDAARRGELRLGGVIVEGTAGNTGIGLTLVANALGYRTVIVIPETQTSEKKDMLRLAGAELVEVPAVPYANENNYVKLSGRLARELAEFEPNGAIWANQFDNTANRQAHIETTGPEIWEQTGGRLHGFVSAVGTGGTLAGVGMALRERNPEISIALADPPGAALFSYYTTGELRSEGSSITEGIGQGRVTGNLQGFAPDESFHIPDDEAIGTVFDLLEHEGLCLGPSSGVNVAGAVRLARQLGPGHTIVTMLGDYGTRYQSKLFNPDFLRSKGLPVPPWLERENPLFQQAVERCWA